MGEQLEPQWDRGRGGYKIVIKEEPGLCLELRIGRPGISLPVMLGVNVVVLAILIRGLGC